MIDNLFQSAQAIKKILPQDNRITLVSGCFDLIHVGHIHLLEYASSLEDLLVVAVLSDEYARRYKDVQRPIIPQLQRAGMVASLRCVDFVYVSNISPNSSETLQLLEPDSIVFGEDLINPEKMEQRIKNVSSVLSDITIRFLPRYTEEEVSTNLIIDKIRGVRT